MLYAVYDFTVNAVMPPRFISWTDAKAAGPPGATIVMRGSTREDYRYLGKRWMCAHCLEPTECIHCNPEYSDAVIQPCTTSEGKHSYTWHVNGECLKCRGD